MYKPVGRGSGMPPSALPGYPPVAPQDTPGCEAGQAGQLSSQPLFSQRRKKLGEPLARGPPLPPAGYFGRPSILIRVLSSSGSTMFPFSERCWEFVSERSPHPPGDPVRAGGGEKRVLAVPDPPTIPFCKLLPASMPWPKLWPQVYLCMAHHIGP